MKDNSLSHLLLKICTCICMKLFSMLIHIAFRQNVSQKGTFLRTLVLLVLTLLIFGSLLMYYAMCSSVERIVRRTNRFKITLEEIDSADEPFRFLLASGKYNFVLRKRIKFDDIAYLVELMTFLS